MSISVERMYSGDGVFLFERKDTCWDRFAIPIQGRLRF